MSSVLFRSLNEELLIPTHALIMFWKEPTGMIIEHDGSGRTTTNTLKDNPTAMEIVHKGNYVILPTEPPIHIPVSRVLMISNSRGVVSIVYRRENLTAQHQLKIKDPDFLLNLFQGEQIKMLTQ